MSDSFSVVISAAGIGSRLGMNMPKVLVPVNGRTIISHQLSLLCDVPDIIVVVGFKARDVISHINEIGRKVSIAFNHRYLETGTAASLRIGAMIANKTVIALDGDVLIDRCSLRKLIEHPRDCLGLGQVESTAPVYAKVYSGVVTNLSQNHADRTNHEWTGLAKLKRSDILGFNTYHVFESISKLLPIDGIRSNSIEIDEPEDLDKAHAWARNYLHHQS
jgi:choline kinase